MGDFTSTARNALVDAVVAALPVAVIYFAGWAYLSSYLGEFSVDATQVEVAFSTVLVYAFIPLLHWTVILYVLALAALLVGLNSARTATLTSRLLATALALAALGLLIVVHQAAKAEARVMAAHVWHGQKSQSIPALDATAQNGPRYGQFQQCVARNAVRQIIGLPDRMFFLCRTAHSPCVHGTMFLIMNDGRIVYSADRVRQGDDDEFKNCSK